MAKAYIAHKAHNLPQPTGRQRRPPHQQAPRHRDSQPAGVLPCPPPPPRKPASRAPAGRSMVTDHPARAVPHHGSGGVRAHAAYETPARMAALYCRALRRMPDVRL